MAEGAGLAFRRLRAAHHGRRSRYRRERRSISRRRSRSATETPLPSFELGIDAPRTGIDTAGGGFARIYGSFISWRDPHTPVPKEIIPQLAFDRLFRNNRGPVVSSVESEGSRRVLAALQRDDTSVLDLVLEDAKSAAQQRQRGRTGCGSMNTSNRCARSSSGCEAAMRPQKRWINQGKFPLERPAPGHARRRTRSTCG